MSLYVHVSGEGPDLVLLHGWVMHGGVFDALLPTLTEQYRVHCIDLPGHGRSKLALPADLQQLATIVQQYVPENAIVMGWSLGGLLALKLAQQHSLRALVLVSTTPRFVACEDWPQGMALDVFAQFFARLQQNLSRTVQDFLRLQVRGDSQAASTFAAMNATLLQHPADATSLQHGLQILRDADERPSLTTLSVPTLVIAGEYDRITHPQASQYLAENLPNARYCMINRAGHAPFISHHEEFLSEVGEFLSVNANVGIAHA
jgi:pimeloyl-[acyl-carrier protein] methyl ester esterase